MEVRMIHSLGAFASFLIRKSGLISNGLTPLATCAMSKALTCLLEPLESRLMLDGTGADAFEVYDAPQMDAVEHAGLMTNPELAWSTYVGGGNTDSGRGIAVDDSGNVYLTGLTYSSDWNAGSPTNSGIWDIFVTKLTSTGSHVWSTFIGSTNSDHGYAIDVDSSSNVYITGTTESVAWVSDGHDTTHNGGEDAVVVALNPDGTHSWSTYLGGDGGDRGYGISVDGLGGLYVVGETDSAGWVVDGFDTSYNNNVDIFVAKLTTLGGLSWSTYMGGDEKDIGYAIDADTAGNVYLTGRTTSAGWALNGYDTIHNGFNDVFVAKLTSAGAHSWSTYMGGDALDEGRGIAVNSSGVYVTGWTASDGWALHGFDTTHNDAKDAFVAKLTLAGAHSWSSYLGGDANDEGLGITAIPSGELYITGRTSSLGWTIDGFDTSYNGDAYDAYVASVSSSGVLNWSSYFGGDKTDEGRGIAVDSDGSVYMTGWTRSESLASGGYGTTYNGGNFDAFVAKIAEISPAVVGRYVFYNNSYFDSKNPAANANDDNAIALDKTALLPGETATFANYTSFNRGINGIMVDIESLAATPAASDFVFKVGNSSDPDSWSTVTASGITVRAGAGVDGSDRITIIWDDNTIQKQWLEVTILSDANGGQLGLAEDDVFYFGNSIGETGNSPTNTFIDGTDFVGVRDNPHNFLNPAALDDAFDINRDRFVDGTDLVLVRDNNTNFLTALKLITVPAVSPGPMFAAPAFASNVPEIESEALLSGEEFMMPEPAFATTDVSSEQNEIPLQAIDLLAPQPTSEEVSAQEQW
ncbi:MAG TPA: hypothetical protein ENL03_03835, partial [Phycisphaerae bacterium]|nr:hypothetical protein [Phycisphaerae bacterium]